MSGSRTKKLRKHVMKRMNINRLSKHDWRNIKRAWIKSAGADDRHSIVCELFIEFMTMSRAQAG